MYWTIIFNNSGTSLVVQWIRLLSHAGGVSSTPGWGTRVRHALGASKNLKRKIHRTSTQVSITQNPTVSCFGHLLLTFFAFVLIPFFFFFFFFFSFTTFACFLTQWSLIIFLFLSFIKMGSPVDRSYILLSLVLFISFNAMFESRLFH